MVFSLTSDEDTAEIDPEGLKRILAHYPCGTSWKSILHFRQEVLAKKFQKYDYGRDENLQRYGTEGPPEYDLTKIQDFPIAFFAGTKDRLAAITDVRWLKEKLEAQNSLPYYFEYDLGHLGFLIPKSQAVTEDILSTLKATHYN